jgi:hypothetical protein
VSGFFTQTGIGKAGNYSNLNTELQQPEGGFDMDNNIAYGPNTIPAGTK